MPSVAAIRQTSAAALQIACQIFAVNLYICDLERLRVNMLQRKHAVDRLGFRRLLQCFTASCQAGLHSLIRLRAVITHVANGFRSVQFNHLRISDRLD